MKDLEKLSGIPKTTIHFYFKEGLLKPAEKRTKNSAIYTEKHLEDIIKIKELSESGFSIQQIKRVGKWLEGGASTEFIIALQNATLQGNKIPETFDKNINLKSIAKMADIPYEKLLKLKEKGFFGDPFSSEYDSLDLEYAKSLKSILDLGYPFEQELKIAEMIFTISEMEINASKKLVNEKNEKDKERIFLTLSECGRIMNRYYFIRARQNDIKKMRNENN